MRVAPFLRQYGGLILIIACWLIPGLLGRTPWKPDEAYTVGLVHHIATTGDWIVPTLAGEPFMEKPPIFFLLAALMGWAFGGLLPFHDAARLASALFIGLSMAALACATHDKTRPGTGRLAVLGLVSSLGLLVHAHQLITDLALMAGIACGLTGLSLIWRQPRWAGIWFGTGMGIAFMSKGLLGPGLLGVTAAALPLLHAPARSRLYLQAMRQAFYAALPWLLIWPIALWLRHPELFAVWAWDNNIGRFLGLNTLGPKPEPGGYFAILPWFALPLWPIALWTVWTRRKQLRQDSQLLVPTLYFVLALAVLSLASDARALYALPLLPPLVMLITPLYGQERQPQRLSFALIPWLLFGLVWVLLVLGWIGLQTGMPALKGPRWLAMRPGFVAQFELWRPMLALLGAVALGWLARRHWRQGLSGFITSWCSGLAAVWLCFMLLWLPWLEWGSGFGPLVKQIRAAMPADTRCTTSWHLGEPQRAMFDYYGQFRLHRLEIDGGTNCDAILVQGHDLPMAITLQRQAWQEIWHGARPGDEKKEPYRLFRRRTSTP